MKELFGPYEWDERPPGYVGLAEGIKLHGPTHPQIVTMARQIAYRAAVPPLDGMGCKIFRVYSSQQLGVCVKRRGHEGRCRFLKLSKEDSLAIEESARRAVEISA